MPITRKLIAQDISEDNQILKMDSVKRFIVNSSEDWQFLFASDSALTNSSQVVKISAEFDALNLNKVRFSAYLFNNISGSIDNASTCEFKLYLVEQPGWTENLITTFNGTIQTNSIFFADILLSSIPLIDFFGNSTIAIECIITRLSAQYRDKVYVNHLGIYDNVFRLRRKVDFLEVTKLDE